MFRSHHGQKAEREAAAEEAAAVHFGGGGTYSFGNADPSPKKN